MRKKEIRTFKQIISSPIMICLIILTIIFPIIGWVICRYDVKVIGIGFMKCVYYFSHFMMYPVLLWVIGKKMSDNGFLKQKNKRMKKRIERISHEIKKLEKEVITDEI